MEKILKKITSKSDGKTTNDHSVPTLKSITETLRTWAAGARAKCREASGSPQILDTCLDENFQKFKQESKDNRERQKELKKPYVEEKESLTTRLKNQKTQDEIKQQSKEEKKKEIESINKKIAEVRAQPEKFGIDVKQKSKGKFLIGLVLLVPITIYLIMFYVSASYSAFFRNFTSDIHIMQSIFDGQAFTKAWIDPDHGGIINLVLISTIPFVFMALGYLIHDFWSSESKWYVKFPKIFLLLATTFAFDALLAYYIDKKIFDMEKLPGEVYDLNIAFESVGFWIIIFAGFVVYLVWGLVFDVVMKEYENLNPISAFIRRKKRERKTKETEYRKLKIDLQQIKLAISDLEGKIDELTAKINGFVFESKAYLLYHTEFLSHWCLEIGNVAMAQEQKKKLLDQCAEVAQKHLEKHKLTGTDAEHIVYS